MLLVLLGGSLLMAFIKGGTIAVLVASEREAGPVEQPPLRTAAVRRANRFSLERATAGAQRLFGRFAWLGGSLFLAYVAVLAAALGALVSVGSPDSAWEAARIAALTAAVAGAVTRRQPAVSAHPDRDYRRRLRRAHGDGPGRAAACTCGCSISASSSPAR